METEVKELQFKHPKARRPQDDLPKDVVIHYIVKDYRRMFNEFENMKTGKQQLIDDLRKKINEKDAKLLSKQKEIHELRALTKRQERTNANLQQQNTENSQLHKEIKELQRKNVLLAQAVIEPNKAVLAPVIHTNNEKRWMVNASKQLEKAAQGLIQAEERFVEYEKISEELQEKYGEYEGLAQVRKRLSRIISRIESCISHVECFFSLTKDITIAEDGNNETED